MLDRNQRNEQVKPIYLDRHVQAFPKIFSTNHISVFCNPQYHLTTLISDFDFLDVDRHRLKEPTGYFFEQMCLKMLLANQI